MPILAINTASSQTELALLNDDLSKVLREKKWPSENKEAEYLMPEIQKLLEIEAYKFDDINDVIVVSGPGSFTGLRIGVVVANTLKYLLPINLFAINTFEYFWAKSGIEDLSTETVLLIYAGQKGLYFSPSPNHTKQSQIKLIPNEKISEELNLLKTKKIIADISEEQKKLLQNFEILDPQKTFGETMIKILMDKNMSPQNIVYPLYIKDPAITKSKKTFF